MNIKPKLAILFLLGVAGLFSGCAVIPFATFNRFHQVSKKIIVVMPKGTSLPHHLKKKIPPISEYEV